MNEELSKQLTVFMLWFERTFTDDWEHGQHVMGIEHREQTHSFLNASEYHDWETHQQLVKAYKALREAMQAEGIYHEH